ncbi:ATP-dependent RNA helicase HrpA [Tessaracoccus oleiagri]|uniref:ATP-dependent helicase HrpA n=1 Tax=Tessaracoccus oleiagri TaxID=686624 RepID=A0A1G9L888_9ACTN|nr:ATP-dependent RNA helicase HrpA [Tessaracoccus oleiagri]SDL58171.1 ATP-dependent helicase HrpA [Tessaracoccus oleiagri]
MTRVVVNPELPIADEAERIADLIRDHQVVVVAGETGSGKTTQLPKIALLAGRERIAHTQPRRLAARTVAQRIADECEVELGDFVGYQVRFTRKAGAATRIKLMTDGILLNELTHDRMLRRYDTIIIDEAHERSLNIDFLLGYLKQLLPKRPELRVIVTSATIDTARFSEHFGDAPIVEVSGRTYPVEIRYREPLEGEDEIDQITAAVDDLFRQSSTGDILVFLSGEREIRDAAEAIEALKLPGLETLPLFARLSAADQARVFQPHRTRRVVLATNVAETSITVPGIRFVVDTGNARISRYSARTKVQRLPIEPVSQASANQRAGRCGRLGPGIAVRLYTEEDFLSRPEFSDPEILRTNLATVILLMAQAGLGDIAKFPFVEAPVTSQINDGIRVLQELGALKDRKAGEELRLTSTGRALARMPVDPRLGRMLLEGARRGCLRQVLVLVAGLTVPDVRERPLEHQQKADELHRRFSVVASDDGGKAGVPEGGDFEALLNVWHYLRRRRRELSGNQFRRMCRDEFLHFVRFREWEDLVSQLREVAKELELRTDGEGAMPDVLRSLLSGLLSNIGLLEPERAKREPGKRRPLREYQGARGTKFAIQPGSALAKSTPPLVVAFELVETSRLWARTVAPIRAEWVEDVAGDLVTRTLSEPRFAQRTSTVVASERVTLFGVPIIAGRRVNYARTHPVEAREIFIRSALVEGEWETRNPLVVANRRALEKAGRLTDRMRRPDLLISDDALYQFYDCKLPETVCSGATLDKWLRGIPKESWPTLTPEQCITDESAIRASDFPEHFVVGPAKLPVDYVFQPGRRDDGAAITVRLEQLGSLDPPPFTWLVPGLRQELATELIRGLPKSVRTSFVPAPDYAARALAWLEQRGETGQGSFPRALGRALTALTGVMVDESLWRPDGLPAHLQPTFVVVEGGKEVARGADLGALRTQLSAKVAQTLTRAAGRLTSSGQRSWTFGTIPVTTSLGGGVIGYPSLVDEGDTVGVQVSDTRLKGERAHVQGLRRLLTLTNPDPTKWVVSHLTMTEKLALADSPYPNVPELLKDAWLKASEQLAERHGPALEVRDGDAYARVSVAVRQDCTDQTRKVVSTAAAALTAASQARLAMADLPADHPVRADVTAQLDNLFFNRFLSFTPDPWLEHLPRYAEAAAHRVRAAKANPARDAREALQVEDLEAEYADLTAAEPPGPLRPAVEEIAFLLEELRVSLFAQQLRTSVPVSAKRVRSAIQRARTVP